MFSAAIIWDNVIEATRLPLCCHSVRRGLGLWGKNPFSSVPSAETNGSAMRALTLNCKLHFILWVRVPLKPQHQPEKPFTHISLPFLLPGFGGILSELIQNDLTDLLISSLNTSHTEQPPDLFPDYTKPSNWKIALVMFFLEFSFKLLSFTQKHWEHLSPLRHYLSDSKKQFDGESLPGILSTFPHQTFPRRSG